MSIKKENIPTNVNFTFLQKIGIILLILGILLLIVCGFSTLGEEKTATAFSGLAATGFFNIMLGISLIYPEMLAGNSGAASTMRMSIFMIVSVFVVLVVKIGWGTADLSNFKLDQTWAYVLAIALGSKAIQYFAEKLPVKEPIADNAPLTKQTSLPSFSATRNVPEVPPFHITEALKGKL